MTKRLAGQPPLDVVFVVQGEGRGHLTQAIALSAHLRDAGHRVVAVYVGESSVRPVPEYFVDEVGAPVEGFEAPILVPDRHLRGMSVGRTAWHSLVHLPAFARSFAWLSHRIRAHRPDVVVNFYDLLAGFAHTFSPKGTRRVAVAHNYLVGHPDAAAAPSGRAGRLGLSLLSWGTGWGAKHRLALSYDELPPHRAVVPVPPLLRPGLERLSVTDQGYLLAYALNPGYALDLATWQGRNPEVAVHCYIEGGRAAVGAPCHPKFQAHDLGSEAFLKHLAGCRAFVGTAGFESTCEAFFLGKPVLSVPVEGQYEQGFNAVDARRAGAARAGSYADLDEFWGDLPWPDPTSVERFRGWVGRAPGVFLRAIEGRMGTTVLH